MAWCYADHTVAHWALVQQGMGIGAMMNKIALATPNMVRVLDDLPPVRFPSSSASATPTVGPQFQSSGELEGEGQRNGELMQLVMSLVSFKMVHATIGCKGFCTARRRITHSPVAMVISHMPTTTVSDSSPCKGLPVIR